MKRFISLLMATLMLVTLLAGCGDNANKDQGSDESTNSVTLRNTGFLTTSDPNQTTNTHEYTVHENIYEGLYDLNEASGGYDLRLAESIEPNEDATEYIAKMIRKIIRIDKEKCNGCGACADACHEGAIDIINGKAELVREHFCDGLGDCLPECPTGAISFE